MPFIPDASCTASSFSFLGSESQLPQQGGCLAIPIQNQDVIFDDDRVITTPDCLQVHTSQWASLITSSGKQYSKIDCQSSILIPIYTMEIRSCSGLENSLL